MKGFGLLMAICIFMWSCESEEQVVPDNLLSENQMVGILVDVHLAESKLNEVKGDISDRVVLFNSYASSIYEQHGTDSVQYISSHNYYMQNLEVMKIIYQRVSDSLKVLRDSAASAKPKVKRIKPKAKTGT